MLVWWVIGLSLLGSLFAHFVSAQELEGQVVSVSPRVGHVIDAEERARFRLFPGIPGFQTAMFLLLPDSTAAARVTTMEEGIEHTRLIRYPGGMLQKVGEAIDRYEEIRAGTYHVTMIWTDTVTSQPALAALPGGHQVGEWFVVKLQDGGELLGELKTETPDELTLVASFGEVRIARSKIKELIRVAAEDIRHGEYWYPDPNQTRSFVFPTASTLPQGKGFYENYYILFNSIHYGVADHAMFSGGVVLFPGGAILTVGPKFQIYQHSAKLVEMALGAHLFIGISEDESVTLFVPYGVLSVGNPREGRINVGVGGVVIEDEERFFLNLSGDVRVARRVKLMGEVFLIPPQNNSDEGHIFPIYGLRFFSEKLAFDTGFWNIPDEEDLTVFGTPLANFVFRF